MLKNVARHLSLGALAEAIWAGAFGGLGLIALATALISGTIAGVTMDLVNVALIILGVWALFSLFFMYRTIQRADRQEERIAQLEDRNSRLEEDIGLCSDIALRKAAGDISTRKLPPYHVQ